MATVEQYQKAIDVFVSGKHNVDDLVHGVLRNHPDLFLKYGYGVEEETTPELVTDYSQAHLESILDAGKLEHIKSALRTGNKVAAIKRVQDYTDWSLRDSKFCIDGWINR